MEICVRLRAHVQEIGKFHPLGVLQWMYWRRTSWRFGGRISHWQNRSFFRKSGRCEPITSYSTGRDGIMQ